MSFIADKVECTGCGDLFDADLLDAARKCHDCRLDDSFLTDTVADYFGDKDDDLDHAAPDPE